MPNHYSGWGTSGLGSVEIENAHHETRLTDHAGEQDGEVTDERNITINKEDAREGAKISPPPPRESGLVRERKEVVVINDHRGEPKKSRRQNTAHPWSITNRKTQDVSTWPNRLLTQKVSRPSRR